VFLGCYPTEIFDKFVNRDSLRFDEKPFNHYRIYDLHDSIKGKITNEKKYMITDKDSLALYNGKCMFYMLY
jgi:hypothetical protein